MFCMRALNSMHDIFSCSSSLSLPLSVSLPFFSAAASSPFVCSQVFFEGRPFPCFDWQSQFSSLWLLHECNFLDTSIFSGSVAFRTQYSIRWHARQINGGWMSSLSISTFILNRNHNSALNVSLRGGAHFLSFNRFPQRRQDFFK